MQIYRLSAQGHVCDLGNYMYMYLQKNIYNWLDSTKMPQKMAKT